MRQEDPLWSALHQGVLTTGYLAQTLGFYEPQVQPARPPARPPASQPASQLAPPVLLLQQKQAVVSSEGSPAFGSP